MGDRLTHGGDWQGYLDRYGGMPLDFSANVSPLGVPAGIAEAIRQAADKIEMYPDPLCRRLTKAIAEHHGVQPGQVLCGCGGADLIYRAASGLAPHRALVAAPTFAEYEEALVNSGCLVEYYPLDSVAGFRVGPDILARLAAEPGAKTVIKPGAEPDAKTAIKPGAGPVASAIDMLFLCEPNNPTGVTTDPDLLLEIAEVCREKGIILFLDESFNEFLDDPEAHSMVGKLEDFPNMMILRAFTKIYAMAGVRLGYLLTSNAAAIREMRAAGQPWAVSVLAQEAGIAALSESEYVRQVRQTIREERGFVRRGLEELGLAVVPGEANYLLFRGPVDLADRMEERGILLRRCDNYRGLGPGWFRTAVRTREDNERLLAALGRVMAASAEKTAESTVKEEA